MWTTVWQHTKLEYKRFTNRMTVWYHGSSFICLYSCSHVLMSTWCAGSLCCSCLTHSSCIIGGCTSLSIHAPLTTIVSQITLVVMCAQLVHTFPTTYCIHPIRSHKLQYYFAVLACIPLSTPTCCFIIHMLGVAPCVHAKALQLSLTGDADCQFGCIESN